MYIQRELGKIIEPFLERRESIAILGPRQAGKTTFLEHLAVILKEKGKKVKQITFENRSDLELFNTGIEDFKMIAEQYDCVIIDEFQYAKEGGQKLKYLYDTTKVKFIISGSSSLELVFQTGKYMVGRLLEFTLFPFSFREFLSFRDLELFTLLEQKISHNPLEFKIEQALGKEMTKRIAALLEEYTIFGGYPAVALTKNAPEKQKVLEGIANNYLLKDVESLLHLATSNELLILEKLLASQIGNMVKYEELSRSSGLAYKELKKHLNILEKTYILSLVRPFFTNPRTELTKNPKVYFMDLGLRNFILSDFRPLGDRQDAGAVMENYAHSILRRMIKPPEEVKYWRTKSKAEVDFILQKNSLPQPFEVKYSSKKTVGKSLHSFIGKFKSSKAVVLTKDVVETEKIGDTQVVFIPLSYF